MNQNILFGAFERDNFGDSLMLLMSQNRLNNSEYRSIIMSDMRCINGSITLPLKNSDTDTDYKRNVLVVGGEVGGLDVNTALSMSLPPYQSKIFSEMRESNRVIVRKALCGNHLNGPAYLPAPGVGVVYLNSVGLSVLDKTDIEIKRESIKRMMTYEYISVRDFESFKFCKKNNIKSYLNPDIVHSISLVHKPRNILGISSYLCFQMNSNDIETVGIRFLASSIKRIIKTLNMKVVLFTAGTAVNHDSTDLYIKLRDAIGSDVIIPTTRNPLELVDIIANSKLWIGTSLHGRIIASAYCISRVSLINAKVSGYAATWDREYPYDVSLGTIMDSIKLTEGKDSTEDEKKSYILSRRSLESIDKLAKILNK